MWMIVRQVVGPVLLAGALGVSLGPAAAAGQATISPPPGLGAGAGDSGHRHHTFFTGREGVAAGALLVSAALLDVTVRQRALADRSHTSDALARAGNRLGTLQVAVPVLAAGWLAGAVFHEPSVTDATLKAFASGVIAGGITGVLKVGFGRIRPRDGGDADSFRPFSRNASFPSGHTTLAVAIATSLAHSTPGPWTDVGFYGVAGLTGFARINDDKHWLSDVVGGALIGYLIGRQLHHDRDPGQVRPLVGPGMVGLTVPLGGPPAHRAARPPSP